MKQLNSAENELLRIASEFGWSVTRQEIRTPQSIDLVIKTSPSKSWGTTLKTVPDARKSQLTASLAAAAVESHRATSQVSRALALVYAPKLSESMLDHLQSYAKQYLKGIADWGALDGQGRFRCPALEVCTSGDEHLTHSRQTRSVAPTRANPFGDLGQWLTKVVLAGEIPEQFLHAERRPTRSQIELAQAAEVSAATVTRWLSSLQSLQLIPTQSLNLRPGPLSEVLRLWTRAANSAPPNETQVVGMMTRNPKQLIRQVLEFDQDAMLCRHSACEALGISIVRGAIPSIYLSNHDAKSLANLGLRRKHEGEKPDIVLVEPRYPQSIQRGAVLTNSGRSTDILQCYVDLIDHPARGREQAEEIRRRLGKMISW